MKQKRNFRAAPIFALALGIIALKIAISLALIVHPQSSLRLEPGQAMAAPLDEALPPPQTSAPIAGQDYPETEIGKSAAALGPEIAKSGEANPGEANPGVEENALNATEMESHRLERERKELELLRVEVEGKIAELETIQKQIHVMLAQLEGAFDKRENHLIKILSEMPPKKSAPMIDKLEMDLVVKLFARMKSDKIASILPFLDPAKAAEIGQKMASRE